MSRDLPPTSEKARLLEQLSDVRNHVVDAIDGLGEAELRRGVLPSGWSALGLIQHLSLDVEKFWFSCVVAGDEAVIASLDEPPQGAWFVGPEVDPSSVIEGYRSWIRRSDEILMATDLEQAPAWWPEGLFGDWRLEDLREIALHVLVETATHAGHMDAWRELIDGKQFLALG